RPSSMRLPPSRRLQPTLPAPGEVLPLFRSYLIAVVWLAGPYLRTVADLDGTVRALAGDGQLVHLERIPPRSPRTAPLSKELPPALQTLVPEGGLWTHQAEAIDLARAGRSVAIATGTASGKSL